MRDENRDEAGEGADPVFRSRSRGRRRGSQRMFAVGETVCRRRARVGRWPELSNPEKKGVAVLWEARMKRGSLAPKWGGSGTARPRGQQREKTDFRFSSGPDGLWLSAVLRASCCRLFLYLFFISANVVKVWPEAGTNCRGS